MDEFFKGLNEKLKDPSLTREQKVKLIQQAGDTYRQNVDKEYKDYRNKQVLGAALEIGSAAIPLGGVSGQAAKRVIPKVVQKTIGRKLTTDTATGAIGGALGGGMFGIGEGLMKGENPLKSSAKEAQSGFLSGGLFGGLAGKMQQSALANNLQGYDKNTIFSNNYKEYRKTAEKYYKDYIHGIEVKNKNIGNISFTRKGMDETLSKNPEIAKSFPELVDNVKNSKYIATNDLYKPRKDQATKQFHTLKSGNNEYLIAEDKLGNQKFYLAKKDTISQGTPSKMEGTSSNGISGLSPTGSINNYLLQHNPSQELVPQVATFNTALNSKMDDLLIPDELKPFLEKHEINNPQATLGGLTLEGNHSGKQHLPLPDLGVTDSINDYHIKNNSPQTPIFNARVEENNFAGYQNPLSGSNRIFAAEEIGDFSTKEFTDYEPEIFAQINTPIGAPSRSELRSAIESSTAVYVEPYYKSDGSYVKGHYRAR